MEDYATYKEKQDDAVFGEVANATTDAFIYTLYQGCLNDDYIERVGGVYRLVYYTFANEWSNHGHVLADENLDYLINWYMSNYGDRLKAQADYEKTTAQDIIDKAFVFFSDNYDAKRILKPLKPSAWNKGVMLYATELLDDLEPQADITEANLLNGAKDWREYSLGGCALIYDKDIASRLCSPSELKRKKGGELPPNKSEAWLDVQARALYQAARLILGN